MIIYMIILLISFLASIVGAICGIGGGVLIKPVMDFMGILSVSTISFLSGLTVLSMSTYTVGKNILAKESLVKMKTGIPISIGAAIGGIIGKTLFSAFEALFINEELIGAVQSACLLILTFGTLLYTINKGKIKAKKINNTWACIIVGLGLGFFSAFLGIGGGPFNLVILSYFFSMVTKEAAQYSLFIIMFSQITSAFQTIITRQVPPFRISLLVGMMCMGICGAVIGRKINKEIDTSMVDRLFVGMLAVIMIICFYNILKYSGVVEA